MFVVFAVALKIGRRIYKDSISPLRQWQLQLVYSREKLEREYQEIMFGQLKI